MWVLRFACPYLICIHKCLFVHVTWSFAWETDVSLRTVHKTVNPEERMKKSQIHLRVWGWNSFRLSLHAFHPPSMLNYFLYKCCGLFLESWEDVKLGMVKRIVLVWSGCYNKIPETGRLINNRFLFLTVLKIRKSKILTSKDSVPADRPLPQTRPSCCNLTRGEGDLSGVPL